MEVSPKEVKEILEEQIITKPGIVGVSVGSPVKVYVEDIETAKRIPRYIAGVPVEVKVIGRVRVLAAFTSRVRPVLPAYSVSHPKVTAGTIGCFVYDREDGKVKLMSNNHVIAASNAGKYGDAILQPGTYDGGRLGRDEIGYLDKYVEIKYAPYYNDMDVALATIETDYRTEIPQIGFITGITAPKKDMRVKKAGRTTGVTESYVMDTNATIKVEGYDGKTAIFRNQMLIVQPFAEGGDSGALILDDRNRAVGLLFAGSDEVAVATPIGRILYALNCDIISGKRRYGVPSPYGLVFGLATGIYLLSKYL